MQKPKASASISLPVEKRELYPVPSEVGSIIHSSIMKAALLRMENATSGLPVDQLFTDEEIPEIHHEFDERVKRYGDWR